MMYVQLVWLLEFFAFWELLILLVLLLALLMRRMNENDEVWVLEQEAEWFLRHDPLETYGTRRKR